MWPNSKGKGGKGGSKSNDGDNETPRSKPRATRTKLKAMTAEAAARALQDTDSIDPQILSEEQLEAEIFKAAQQASNEQLLREEQARAAGPEFLKIPENSASLDDQLSGVWKARLMGGAKPVPNTAIPSPANRVAMEAAEKARTNAQHESMIHIVDRMFDQFQNLAYDFNQVAAASDLELTWIRPSIARENVGTWHQGAQYISVFSGRVSTRYWTLVVRGSYEGITAHIIPADKLLTFNSNPASFMAMLEMVPYFDGTMVYWSAGQKQLKSEDVQQAARAVMDSLVQVAQEDMPPTRPIDLFATGVFHNEAAPQTAATADPGPSMLGGDIDYSERYRQHFSDSSSTSSNFSTGENPYQPGQSAPGQHQFQQPPQQLPQQQAGQFGQPYQPYTGTGTSASNTSINNNSVNNFRQQSGNQQNVQSSSDDWKPIVRSVRGASGPQSPQGRQFPQEPQQPQQTPPFAAPLPPARNDNDGWKGLTPSNMGTPAGPSSQGFKPAFPPLPPSPDLRPNVQGANQALSGNQSSTGNQSLSGNQAGPNRPSGNFPKPNHSAASTFPAMPAVGSPTPAQQSTQSPPGQPPSFSQGFKPSTNPPYPAAFSAPTAATPSPDVAPNPLPAPALPAPALPSGPSQFNEVAASGDDWNFVPIEKDAQGQIKKDDQPQQPVNFPKGLFADMPANLGFPHAPQKFTHQAPQSPAAPAGIPNPFASPYGSDTQTSASNNAVPPASPAANSSLQSQAPPPVLPSYLQTPNPLTATSTDQPAAQSFPAPSNLPAKPVEDENPFYTPLPVEDSVTASSASPWAGAPEVQSGNKADFNPTASSTETHMFVPPPAPMPVREAPAESPFFEPATVQEPVSEDSVATDRFGVDTATGQFSADRFAFDIANAAMPQPAQLIEVEQLLPQSDPVEHVEDDNNAEKSDLVSDADLPDLESRTGEAEPSEQESDSEDTDSNDPDSTDQSEDIEAREPETRESEILEDEPLEDEPLEDEPSDEQTDQPNSESIESISAKSGDIREEAEADQVEDAAPSLTDDEAVEAEVSDVDSLTDSDTEDSETYEDDQSDDPDEVEKTEEFELSVDSKSDSEEGEDEQDQNLDVVPDSDHGENAALDAEPESEPESEADSELEGESESVVESEAQSELDYQSGADEDSNSVEESDTDEDSNSDESDLIEESHIEEDSNAEQESGSDEETKSEDDSDNGSTLDEESESDQESDLEKESSVDDESISDAEIKSEDAADVEELDAVEESDSVEDVKSEDDGEPDQDSGSDEEVDSEQELDVEVQSDSENEEADVIDPRRLEELNEETSQSIVELEEEFAQGSEATETNPWRGPEQASQGHVIELHPMPTFEPISASLGDVAPQLVASNEHSIKLEISRVIGAFDKELEIISGKGSDAFARRDLKSAEHMIKLAEMISEYKEGLAKLKEEYDKDLS